MGRYEALARAFDQVAPNYDVQYDLQSNLLMSWMRRESIAVLKATFPPKSQLLEIGCGTGEEAMHLARAGCKVLATDISPKMVSQTSNKVRAAGLSDRISCLTIPAGHLGALKPDEAFDGAYASFGSLNCEPALDRLVTALANLLCPGAAFVCSVMARWCPVEFAWHLSRLHPRQAFHRFHRGWQMAYLPGADGEPVNLKIRYLSVSDLKRVFSPAFVMDRARAFPLLLPPPHLDSAYRKHRTAFDFLEQWELRLRDRWPFHGFGDHFMIVFRRR